MKQVCDYIDCTGCSLCSVVCPKKCISMRQGGLGHLYPEIDTVKCIDCGLCVKSCPSLPAGSDHVCGNAGQEYFRLPSAAYAAWAKDENEYRSSTSGGAASVLAGYFISIGGVVYGASSVSADGLEIRHIRVTDKASAAFLKGSKYVQSSITDVLPLVRKDVGKGLPVLFIGTPCQVAAVLGLFAKRPENLFLVDLICHGVPSMSLFRKYVRKYLHISLETVRSVSFRTEGKFRMEIRGKRSGMQVSEEDLLYTHAPLTGLRTEELFYNLFMDGFTYRDSCYRCRYACANRISDMTIGDFWGLGNDVPVHPHGVSLILPLSDSGRKMLGVLKDNMYLYERTVQEAVAGNEQLRKPKYKSIRIRLFRTLSKIFGMRVYYPLVSDYILRKR